MTLKLVADRSCRERSEMAKLISFMRDYQKLGVWQKAHNLSLEIYKSTAHFPRNELCGITRQIRISCASIPDKIAEGCNKDGDAELGNHLQTALSSTNEVESHLLHAHDLGYLQHKDYQHLSGELTQLKRSLTNYIHKLRSAN